MKQIYSKLSDVINAAWSERDLNTAKKIVTDFIQDSKIKDSDKQKIINTVQAQTKKSKLDYYLANALLKYEGLGTSLKETKILKKLPDVIKGVLKETKVTDPKLIEEIKEFAELSDQIDVISGNLKKLQNRYKEIESNLRPVLEELKETKNRTLEVENIIVTIKREGYTRESASYKEAYEWLKNKVNRQLKKLVEEALEATKKTSKVASSIGVQKLDENRILNALKKFWNRITQNIKTHNKNLTNAIRDFKTGRIK
jgi:septal ring factor EnvC (AmiA/AmiB activator)